MKHHFCANCGHEWAALDCVRKPLNCTSEDTSCPACCEAFGLYSGDLLGRRKRPWKYIDDNDFTAYVMNVRMGVYNET